MSLPTGLCAGLPTGHLPTGLAWRAEFAPQHVEGAEKPAASSNTSNPAEANTSSTTTTELKSDQKGIPPGCVDNNMLLMMGAMFLVLYFFMIRPGQKQEKKLKQMRSNLQKGDAVVTNSGLHGEILSVDEKAQTVTLKTDDEGRVRMTFDQAAISRRDGDEGGAAKT